MPTTIDLFRLLSQAGVERLRQGRKEIMGACPMHEERTGDPDTHPSWSINRQTMVHHCFSCGYSGTLTGLLVDLTGAAPPDLEEEIKEQSFLRQMTEIREHPEETLAPVIPIITDWMLVHVLVDVPEKLLQLRRLRREAIARYEVRWDHDRRSWVMPLRTVTGSLLGAQYRRIGQVLTLPEGMSKSQCLFGYTAMCQYDDCVLVESPLDAVRLFGLGIPALASLGAWVSADQMTMLARCFSCVYVALDNDKAGQEGAEVVHQGLRRRGCAAVPWRYDGLLDDEGQPAKDVGDAASDEALWASWEATRRWGM